MKKKNQLRFIRKLGRLLFAAQEHARQLSTKMVGEEDDSVVEEVAVEKEDLHVYLNTKEVETDFAELIRFLARRKVSYSCREARDTLKGYKKRLDALLIGKKEPITESLSLDELEKRARSGGKIGGMDVVHAPASAVDNLLDVD